MSERRMLVNIETWGPGLDAYVDEVIAELAPALARHGADGGATGAGGLAGGPNASFGILSPPGETLADVVARAVACLEAACAELGIRHEGIALVEVQDPRYWDLELAREPDRYLGVTEIAELLGVSRQRVMQLRQRADFPEPVAELAAGPVWRMFNLQRFIEEWPRKPGRPRKLESA
ncbi:MAG TPA: hypothetical protein VFK59_00915 [Actinomycetota bacterium]|jgi:hypothetical protein|nr:hypothetical protein [Actinomycetota bacterium]